MATTSPATSELERELVRQLGERPLTAREIAAALTAASDAGALLHRLDEVLIHVATGEEADGVDEQIWGPEPDDARLAADRRVAAEAVQETKARILTDAMTREEVAARLGISPQAVSKRLNAGQLTALSTGRKKWFPAWQIDDDSVLAGLSDVIASYPGSALSLSVWSTTPNPDLDSRTPAEFMARRGALPRVLEALQAVTPAAW